MQSIITTYTNKKIQEINYRKNSNTYFKCDFDESGYLVDEEFYDNGKLSSVYEIELSNNEDPDYANTLKEVIENNILKVTSYYSDQITAVKYYKTRPNGTLHGPSFYYNQENEIYLIEWWYDGMLEFEQDEI